LNLPLTSFTLEKAASQETGISWANELSLANGSASSEKVA
jgi:hypothetical protein